MVTGEITDGKTFSAVRACYDAKRKSTTVTAAGIFCVSGAPYAKVAIATSSDGFPVSTPSAHRINVVTLR